MTTFGLSPEWSTSFVGRRQELAWLRARLELALHGYGHLLLVEGEAGMGKTRLVQTLLEEARATGALVIRGRCYEQLDLAYLPLRDGLLAHLADRVAARVDDRGDLDLLQRIAGLDGRPGGDASPTVDDYERTRQLLALTRLVIEEAREHFVVLFVDDIDWADEATVDLLRHVLFRLDDEAVSLLTVVTSRRDPDARAAAGIERLRGDPRAATIRLHSLTPLEATELAREVEPTISVDQARRLAAAAGGNPLLVEALARRDVDGVATASGTRHPLVAAIDARLRELDAPTRAVMYAAALLVPDCTPSLLGEVTGFEPDVLQHALTEALDAGVVTLADGTVAFVHPLYTHTLHQQISPAARRELHARIATTLLAQRSDGAGGGAVRGIAHHLIESEGATDRDLVFEYTRRAGDDAMAVTAWAEAARCYEAAIGAAPSDSSRDDAVALQRLAGLCHRANLDLPRAVARFEGAMDLLGTDGDPAALVDLHSWRIRCGAGNQDLLHVARDRGPLEQLVDVIEDARPDLAAEGLVELAQSYWVDGDVDRAEAAARRAMAIADRVDDHETYARATTALLVPLWARYDLHESLAALEEGTAHARAAASTTLLAGGPSFRVPIMLTWLGRLDEVQARADECLAAAERAQYPLEGGLPLAALTQLAVARGEFDAAEQYAHQALLIQRLSGYPWAAGLYLPALMAAHVARGRWAAARTALETWEESADDVAMMTIGLMARYVDACERGHATEGSSLPRLPRAPAVGVDGWAAAHVEIARREGAVTDFARVDALLDSIDARGGVLTSGLVMLVPRLRGVAADQLGDEGRAVVHLEQAINVGERIGAAPEVARARVDLATILSRRGDHRGARALVDRASETFERLAMVPDLERAEELTGGRGTRAPARDDGSTVESVFIFFSDVVDSTRHTEELGATRYRAVAREVEMLVRSAIVSQGGSVVTGINLGDGLIGLFPSPARAIAAARRCAADVPATGLHLHLAVHGGEVIVDGPRIFGGPVNLAARICDLTGPDEILVSESIRAAAADLHGVAFVDRGEHLLKGIERPQRTYAVVDAVEAGTRLV
ncbi:MAG: AAA family ATPase [Acidimicrobiia bacterium]